MSAMQQLRDLYASPTAYATQWQQDGGHVAGTITPDVPEELIIAAGMLPLRLKGNPDSPLTHANKYLRQSFNPFFSAIFDRILDFTYGFVDRLILSNLDESVVRLFYYLREINRLEPIAGMPPVHYFEFLHLKSDSSYQYSLDRMHLFKQQIAGWTGKPVTDEDLRGAIGQCNAKRRLLAELAQRRQQMQVSGVDALRIIGGGILMDTPAYNHLLQTALREHQGSQIAAKARIFVTGSSLDNTQLYEMIEATGAHVVDEDSDWGGSGTEGQIDGSADPLAAITDFYFNRRPYPTKATIEERATYCLQRAQEARADGVIFFIYQGDHTPHWDYPEQKAALDAHGIPSLYLPMQPYTLSGSEELRGQISAFVESLAHVRERQA